MAFDRKFRKVAQYANLNSSHFRVSLFNNPRVHGNYSSAGSYALPVAFGGG